MKSFINYVSKLMYCSTVLNNSNATAASCGVINVMSIENGYTPLDVKRNGSVEAMTTIGNVGISLFAMFMMYFIVNDIKEIE